MSRMRNTIGIDPGTRMCGCATFRGSDIIDVLIVKSKERSVVGRALDMASQIRMQWPGADVVVVERPVIYPEASLKDPNDPEAEARKPRDSDILDLGITAGVIGGVLTKSPGLLVMPEPRAWKGTTPKKIHNRRTLAKCPAAATLLAERKIPEGQHNHVLDGVGLALWQLERTR